MRSWSWLWCSALFALAGGCVAGPTQLVVVVDSDLAIPAELDRVRVTVMADDTRMASEEQALGSASLLPLTVAAVPEDDSLGPIDVIAEGFVGSALVVSRRARVTLVRNETRMLRLDLVASCVGTDCGADRSCGENGCVDVVIDELPPWPGTAPRLLDAGGMDADVARDGGARDGGPRDGGGPIDANRPDGSLPPTDASTTACMDDSECDDGILCTTDACMGGLCVSTPDDSVCDDGNGCTDDRCTAAGCTMDPNVLPCDDGVFCNGFDRCAAGSCDMHGGDPCASPTVCDEAGTRCTGCRDDSDCPGPSNGAWGACDYADGCDESGTRMRTNRSYACMGGSCVPTDTPESEPCSRSTDGDTCGVGSCGSYGACNYSDGCDESATRSRTCTDLTCAGGLCRSNNRNETAACTRSTTGTSCGTTSCGSYGACDYSDGCDQSANRTRTCMDFACASGTCAATPRMESMACTRTTTGNSCGTESCGMYGACGYSSTCDEDGSRSRTCTQPTCAGGSCSGSTMRTDTATCTRSTEGTSCGAAQICRMGSCVSCTPILSGSFGTVGSTYFTAATGSGTTLTFADSTPSMGSVTASAGVTFSGSVTSTSCIWQVLTSGSSMTFTDFGGLSIGSITVSGASLSGSGNPACSPTPYGCFPPCLNRVVGSSGSLQLLYSDGSSGTITFGCP
ncbi:MAG: hypothetical protein H6719_25565 [Sandaracinaceae bacterium]|nr:hypothetical protein [Sandaracinaceae bacterium]